MCCHSASDIIVFVSTLSNIFENVILFTYGKKTEIGFIDILALNTVVYWYTNT